MDVAYYISDLLQQQGELSVPHLGYFVQMRVNARYDETEKKFFPPSYVVHFDPQVIDDDDTLATYITGLKNISLASAKYFIEKYISGLKDNVIVEDVAFANLGTFSSDGMKLIFKPAAQNGSPEFFGSPVLDAHKVGEKIDYTATPASVPAPTEIYNAPVAPVDNKVEIEPVEIEKSVPARPPVVNLPLDDAADIEADPFAEEPPRRFFNLWTITLMALAAIAIALFTLYKLRPGMFGWYFSLHKSPYIVNHLPAQAKKDTTTAQMPGTSTDSLAADTLKNSIDTVTVKTTAAASPAVSRPDTIAVKSNVKRVTVPQQPGAQRVTITTPKAAQTTPVPSPATAKPVAAAPVAVTATDAVPKGSWVIYAGAFPTRQGADKTLSNYKAMGFPQARLLTTKVGPGGNYKIIMGGGYTSRADADDAKKELLLTGKLKKTDLSVERLNK